MRVILHADDFGFDKDTTEATIELLDKGSLTSASIMVNMPASNVAIAYAKNHPEKSWGVHLTYVDKLKPVLEAAQIPSLVDGNGLFFDSDTVRKRALLFKVAKEDVIAESLAQITKLQDAGISVSHLDSHGHLHKFPSFLFSMKYIAERTGIKRVRRVQNIFINAPHGVSPKSIVNNVFDRYIKYSFRTTDYFYMSANSMDTHWAENICDQLNKQSQNEVIEVGVHPGNTEVWRAQEKADILVFHGLLKKDGHEIINWNYI